MKFGGMLIVSTFIPLDLGVLASGVSCETGRTDPGTREVRSFTPARAIGSGLAPGILWREASDMTTSPDWAWKRTTRLIHRSGPPILSQGNQTL
jgi:hypothetical protein